MAIANGVNMCWEAFLSITKNGNDIELGDSPSEMLLYKIEKEQKRFEEWTMNYGAHHRKSKSLDEKLRESPHLSKVVMSCFDQLRSCLSRIQDLRDALLTKNMSILNKQVSSGRNHASDSSSSEDEEPLPPIDAGKAVVRRLCSSVSIAIDALLRLSISFRNPVPVDRYKRAAAIDVSYFAQLDEQSVTGKFPNIERYLQERLVRSLRTRRKFLSYCRMQHFKLAHGFIAEVVDDGRCSAEVSIDDADTTVSEIPTLEETNRNNSSDVLQRRAGEGQSITSYDSHPDEPPRLRFPGPPYDLPRDPFPCPLCYLYIEPKSKHEWK